MTWIISKSVDQTWLVGMMIKNMDKKMFDNLLEIFYKKREEEAKEKLK